METNNANRLHIGIFGATNVGKSSLINAIVGQNVAIVSSVKGTTTDPVYKAMEINGLGAVRFIDTAGLGDDTELGVARTTATIKAMDLTDVALLVIDNNISIKLVNEIVQNLDDREIPYIVVYNAHSDVKNAITPDFLHVFKDIITVNAKTGENIPKLIERIALLKKPTTKILDGIVNRGDKVLLVMPQDKSAPQGRLILPQVTVIRELLDIGAIGIFSGVEELLQAIHNAEKIDLIITDSQVFKEVSEIAPSDIPLTSFSVLLSAEKGDMAVFLDGALAMDRLKPDSKVLIAEACTHIPQNEDIGRVKIPNLLKKVYGITNVSFVNGSDFKDNLIGYDLIIHCGGCMYNRRFMMARVNKAVRAGVPITNYGIAIAKMNGILDRITLYNKSE